MPTEAFPRLPIRVGVKVLSGFAFRSQDFSSTGIPVVKIKNIQNRQVHLDSDSYILPEAVTEKMEKFYLKDRDILIAMTGQGSVGRVGQLRLPSKQKVLLNQRVGKFYVDESKINAGYLYQILSTEYYERILFDAGSGSGQPNLSPSQIESLEIPLPPLAEQKAIAHILGTLDDKIEVNRKMNETLEAMARALFKSWFVDFDPVRRNMARRGVSTPLNNPASVPERSRGAEIDALFPSEFEDSALGEIPKGWRVGKIKDCASAIVNGGTPLRDKLEYWSHGKIPWLTSGEVRQSLIIKTSQYITDEGLANCSAKWLSPDSTVVALYGATAGQVALVMQTLTTNQAVCGINPLEYYRYYVYLKLSSNVAALAFQARGSAQQNISKGIVESFSAVLPPESVLRQFDKICNPVFEKWHCNIRANDDLATIRDTLLPKLISGELRVKNAERFVGGVV